MFPYLGETRVALFWQFLASPTLIVMGLEEWVSNQALLIFLIRSMNFPGWTLPPTGGIVSNPPYIRTEEIQHLMRDVRDFEPLMALDGGEDGLAFYRRLIRESSTHLRTGGILALEIGYDQKEAVKSLFDESEGLEFLSSHQDLGGCDRVILGQCSVS